MSPSVVARCLLDIGVWSSIVSADIMEAFGDDLNLMARLIYYR